MRVVNSMRGRRLSISRADLCEIAKILGLYSVMVVVIAVILWVDPNGEYPELMPVLWFALVILGFVMPLGISERLMDDRAYRRQGE